MATAQAIGTAGRGRREWSLRVPFVLLFAVFALTAAAAVVYVARTSSRDATNSGYTTARTNARAAAQSLSETIATVRGTAQSFAASPGVSELLAHPSLCSLNFSLGAIGSHLDVVRPDGTVACSSRQGTASYRGAAWLAAALHGSTWQAPVTDPRSGGLAAVAADRAAGGKAVVAVFVDLKSIGPALLTAVGPVDRLALLVTDAHGSRILARSLAPAASVGKRLPGPGFPSAGTFRRDDPDGTPRLYAAAPVRGAGWIVYGGLPRSTVLAKAHRLVLRDTEIAFAGLAAMLLAAFVAYRAVSRPLHRLASAVSEARSTDAHVQARGPAEVRQLADDVNGLLDSVASELAQRRASEESYRLLFERHPGPMWVYDPKSLRILAVNDAAVAMYGYSAEEFTSMTTDQLVPEEDADALREVLADRRAFADDQRIWRHVTKAGTRLDVRRNVAPIRFEGRDARLLLLENVSEKRLVEEQLQQAQKMEAVGNLAGGIAHDFNNMLTVVRTSAALMLRRVEDERLRDDVLRIDGAAERAAKLTRQLLAFSRRQVLRPEVVDVNAVVLDAGSLLERLLGEHIEIVYDLERGGGSIVIDAGQLTQVLINLAVNARDAMPDGGRLRIHTASVVLDEGYAAEHPEVEAGPYMMLQITDTGAGMDEATRAQVFEPFFTTKEGGTGLGLATVYGVVRQSNGHIWVYSEPGLGTTFKLYFPQVRAEQASGRRAVSEPATVGGGETVLLVEDEPGVRELVSRMLTTLGYSVLEATRGDEALELAAAYDGPIDLLLTDVVMPGMNGRDLADRLRETRPDVAVLFTSGYPADMAVRHGIEEGSADYIEKPFLPDDFARAVRRVLDDR